MRTVNGTKLYWQTEDDLPGFCCNCPWYYDGSTNAPVPQGHISERGLCSLRDMMKGRWTETPQACLRFFKRILKAPDGGEYVIVFRDQ